MSGLIPMQQAYQLLTSSDKADLAEQVNELLGQGWQCHGAPFAHGFACGHEIAQAMVLIGFAQVNIPEKSRIAVPQSKVKLNGPIR